LADVFGPVIFFPKGRNHCVSSNEQPGWHDENLDMDWLMPGGSANMPVLEGPGIITHIYAMVVESPGKDHWRHSWKGLDPRR
jgi:hypothetical protein